MLILKSDFQISRKYIFVSLGTAIGILTIVFFGNLIYENLWPKKLTIAAGKKAGESYIISKAIEKIVEDKTNIEIEVCETDGTDDNLRALEGEKLEGEIKCESNNSNQPEVHLATAQADRVLSNMPVRSLATLYEDHLQLLVKPSQNFKPEEFKLSSLKGKTIVTPKGGGQRQSLIVVAKHLGFFPFKNLDTNNETDETDAVFYVRSLGHKDIKKRINQGWRLVPIENASALRNNGHFYYRNSKIPQKNYGIEPSQELQTIAVNRLLLAQKDVPNWVIKKITLILEEHDNDIQNEILKTQNNKAVASLVRNITKPSLDGDIKIHPGVDAYYKSLSEPFLIKYADFWGLILTISGLLYALYINIKNSQANAKIEQVIELIKESSDNVVSQDDKDSKDKDLEDLKREYKEKLNRLFAQHQKIDAIFQEASTSLDSGGFRVFSEVYKSTREMIERGIEDKQRRLSSIYVQELVNVQDSNKEPNELSLELEQKFIKTSRELLEDKIFSRESFLTFTEAYDIVIDTIVRKKQEQSNSKNSPQGSDINSQQKTLWS